MTKHSGSGPVMRAGSSFRQRQQRSCALSKLLRSTLCSMQLSVVWSLWPKDKISLDKVFLLPLKVYCSLSKALASDLGMRLDGASYVKLDDTPLGLNRGHRQPGKGALHRSLW